MPTPAEIDDEDRRLAELQGLVDRAEAGLREGRIPAALVEDVIAGLRQEAERLFPGQKRSFELIYKPRLLRAATQQ
ncbi:MAG: hypothetical protein GX774_01555 [Armatimonadetes bacterium]|jgi:hypothetical protein|nr:hypothetical protein [Armatimonadota bacterium]